MGFTLEKVNLTLHDLSTLCEACLLKYGCDERNASAVTNIIVSAERDGASSHGLFRLPGYVKSLRSGKVNGKARPRIHKLSPNVLNVDGDDGYAPLALKIGLPLLINSSRELGLAALGLTRIHHFAALWPEIETLTNNNLVGLAFVTSSSAVAPAGTRQAFFGTNPISFGWPRPGGTPVVFDQATSTMARGDIQIAARDRRPVEFGVGLGGSGQPTTDPAEIINAGVQLAFGGYKGSSLSLMVELLSAGLLGERFGYEAAHADCADGGPARSGQLVIAFDPHKFGDTDSWVQHCEAFFARLSALEGVRLPAERRHANRGRSVSDGVFVPRALFEEVRELLSA